jgi:hypothetical protein
MIHAHSVRGFSFAVAAFFKMLERWFGMHLGLVGFRRVLLMMSSFNDWPAKSDGDLPFV